MNKYICIHGHFYQPPRENAWLEEIELQESAHPFHDWNERINIECYQPNTASRILNGSGEIIDITNNYSQISFNFGPTLLSWMEHADPQTYHQILEADRISQKKFSGHGNAIAQVYNHMILPLANRRDKETQVIWGIKDFEHRFKRQPEGMWLAESAVDTESLEVLADNDIKFTILAPGQAQAFKLSGDHDWTDVNGHPVNSKVPYKYILPSGKEIVIYFYDGDISQAVAFNHLLNNGQHFADKLLSGFDDSIQGPQLINIATDGESYGHHHHKGEMALAYCLNHINKGRKANITNYGEYLDIVEQLGECKIIENSSWSCIHGVERWKDNCGCNSGGHPNWNQEWRKPLRESLDWLRDEINTVIESEAGEVLNDPWDARDKYIDVIIDRESNTIHDYLNEHPSQSDLITKGTRWLELQRHAMLMYTSCGWFFDEVSGIETTQILQYACRAIQLLDQLTGKDLEPEFVERLRQIPSNLDEFESAADVYNRYVIPTRLDLERVGMHFAISALFEKDPETLSVFNYTTQTENLKVLEAGVQKFASGITTVRSDVTFSEKKFWFAVLYLGQHNIIGNISLDMSEENFIDMRKQLSEAFRESRLGDMIGLMQEHFGPHKYTLWHLFKDQKLKVINQIMDGSLRQVDNSMRKIYNRDYPLVNMMKTSNIPVPKPYLTTLEYVLNEDLRRCFVADDLDLDELERIAVEFEKWNLKIDDGPNIQRNAGKRIYKSMKKLHKNRKDMDRLRRLNEFFVYLERFGIEPELSKSQNLYFYVARNAIKSKDKDNPVWMKEFKELGDHMGVIAIK